MEPHADDEPMPEIEQVAYRVIGAAIEVHRVLGPGYPESVYEAALAIEFDHRGIAYQRQHRFHVFYCEKPVGEGVIDFFVEQKLVVEIKAIEALGKIHTGQTVSYLRAKHTQLGLLINFNVLLLKEGIKRVALTHSASCV